MKNKVVKRQTKAKASLKSRKVDNVVIPNTNSEDAMDHEPSEPIIAPDATLKPIGDLTIFEAAQFHEDLWTLQKQEGPLELDLSEVDRMDSSCVQLIVAATRSGRLTLQGYSQQIRDRFEQIGFAQFLPTLD